MTTEHEEQAAQAALPWRQRRRRRLLDAAPSWRFLQAMWAFPYLCLGFVVAWVLGGELPEGLPLLIVFSVVALAETVFLVMWLRRPVEGPARRAPWRPSRSPESGRH